MFTLESDNDVTLAERAGETIIQQNKFKKLVEKLKKKMALHKAGSEIINLPTFEDNLNIIYKYQIYRIRRLHFKTRKYIKDKAKFDKI